MEELIRAIKNNNVEKVRNLLEDGLQPDFVNKCVSFNNLLETKSKYDLKISLLDYVVKTNNIEILKLLLDNGGREYIEQHNSQSKGTVLHTAVSNGNLEIIKLLLDYGADIEAKDMHGETPLFKAVYVHTGDYFDDQEKYSEIIDLLLQYKANINAVNDDGNTPMLAITKRYYSDSFGEAIFKEIIILGQYAYNIYDNDDHTAMIKQFCNNEKVQKLFDMGADVNIANNNGENMLMCCFYSSEDKFLNPLDLIQQSTIETINAQDIHGKTPLMHTISAAALNDNAEDAGIVEFVRELIKKGANINIKDNEGNDVLFYLMDGYLQNIEDDNEYCNDVLFKIANELVNAGLDIRNIYDNENLDMEFIRGMAEYGCSKAIPYLYDIKNIRYHDCAKILSNIIGEINCIDILNELIKSGLNVNVKDENGKSILMYIIEKYRSPEVVEPLLKAGADVNAVDNEGSNVLLYGIRAADKRMDTKVCKLLINYGAKLDINNKNIRKMLLNGIINRKFGTIYFAQENNQMFSILNEADFDNQIIKQSVFKILSREGFPVDINDISNANKIYVINTIEKALFILDQIAVSSYHGINTPMKDFVDFGTATSGIELTQEEKNDLNNMAMRFDNAIVNKNKEEIAGSINKLLILCKTSENIYKVINLIISENIIYKDTSKSLTKLLNFYGFNTRRIDILIQINKLFGIIGITDTIGNGNKKSVINKYFELIYKVGLNNNVNTLDNIYALSQNEDINNACLTFQREKTEENKQNFINTIIDNTNNEDKQLLIRCLANINMICFKINNKDLNFATLLNIATGSNLGKCLFIRLKQELQLNNVANANNALNNNQQQLQ